MVHTHRQTNKHSLPRVDSSRITQTVYKKNNLENTKDTRYNNDWPQNKEYRKRGCKFPLNKESQKTEVAEIFEVFPGFSGIRPKANKQIRQSYLLKWDKNKASNSHLKKGIFLSNEKT